MDRDFFEMWLKWQGYYNDELGYWFRKYDASGYWFVKDWYAVWVSLVTWDELVYKYKDLDLEGMMSIAVCRKYYG